MQDSLKIKEIFTNINNHFEFIVCDIWDVKKHLRDYYIAVDYDDYIKRFSILYDLMKDILKKIEDGELDISKYILYDEHVFNINEVKKSLSYYENLFPYCHGIFGKDKYNQHLIDLHQKHIDCLKLFLSKININININNEKTFLSKEKNYI